MISLEIRKAIFRCAFSLITVFISGCPVPIPAGYNESSRENLSTDVINEFKTGVSTREDVLLVLGEPDIVAEDESWMIFNSVRGKGGLAFVLFVPGGAGGVGTEKMEYKRLITTFDEQDILSGANFVSRDCWEAILAADPAVVRSPPCIHIDSPNNNKP